MTDTLQAAPVRTPVRTRDLPSLTSLRALAALGVFAFHLTQWHVAVLPGMALGYAGVAFFFVLSGFVLTWAYSAGASASRFYVRRFARIYPSFLATWLIVFLLPVTSEPVSVGPSVVNLTLLQSWIPVSRWTFAMNGVCWTLSCEMAFYAAFPWLLRWATRQPLRRVWQVAVGAFACEALTVLMWPQLDGRKAVATTVLSLPLLRFPEFVLGVAAALSVRAGSALPAKRRLAALVAACAIGAVLLQAQPNMNIWLAPCVVVLLWAAAQRDCAGHSGVFASRWLVYAGKVSFAFYLVHEMVILNVRHFAGPGWSTAALSLVIACIAAVALHHGVEVPAQKAIVRRLGARRRTAPSESITLEPSHT